MDPEESVQHEKEEEIKLFGKRMLKQVNVSYNCPYRHCDIIVTLSKILSHPLCLLIIS
jgi:hypothetical protein